MTRAPKKTYPLVLISWKDHASTDSWEDESTIKAEPEDPDVRSVGWLVHETPNEYRIVQNISVDGSMSMRMTLLKSTVTSVKVLRKHG